MFKPLDPLLHAELRLAVMSLLMGVIEAEFNYLKDKTGASADNLSVQLSKLQEAGYVEITKTYRSNRPLTLCQATEKGRMAFTQYIADLRTYLEPPAT